MLKESNHIDPKWITRLNKITSSVVYSYSVNSGDNGIAPYGREDMRQELLMYCFDPAAQSARGIKIVESQKDALIKENLKRVAREWAEKVRDERRANSCGDAARLAEPYYGRYGPEVSIATGGIGLASATDPEYMTYTIEAEYAEKLKKLDSDANSGYDDEWWDYYQEKRSSVVEERAVALKTFRVPGKQRPDEARRFIQQALSAEYGDDEVTDAKIRLLEIAIGNLADRGQIQTVLDFLTWMQDRPKPADPGYARIKKAGQRATEVVIRELNKHFSSDPRFGHEGPGGRKADSNVSVQYVTKSAYDGDESAVTRYMDDKKGRSRKYE